VVIRMVEWGLIPVFCMLRENALSFVHSALRTDTSRFVYVYVSDVVE